MNIWLKCEICNHHEHAVSKGSFSMSGCPKCGSSDTLLSMGGPKPEWYKSKPDGVLSRIRAALARKP